MHTDIGVGYKEQGLSDVPFIWLCLKAIQHGLLVYDTERAAINPKADGLMHNSRAYWWQKPYRIKLRCWHEDREDNLVIHQSVLDRAKKAEYDPWVLLYKLKVAP